MRVSCQPDSNCCVREVRVERRFSPRHRGSLSTANLGQPRRDLQVRSTDTLLEIALVEAYRVAFPTNTLRAIDLPGSSLMPISQVRLLE